MNIQSQDTIKNLLRKLAYPSKLDEKSYLNLMSQANNLLQESLPDENNVGIEETKEALDHLLQVNAHTKGNSQQYGGLNK